MFCHSGSHKNSCSVTEVATKTHVLLQRWPQKLMFCHRARGGHKNSCFVTEVTTQTHVLWQRWPHKLIKVFLGPQNGQNYFLHWQRENIFLNFSIFSFLALKKIKEYIPPCSKLLCSLTPASSCCICVAKSMATTFPLPGTMVIGPPPLLNREQIIHKSLSFVIRKNCHTGSWHKNHWLLD